MKVKLLTGSIISGVAAATLITSPALAWHPVGYIQKTVQDQTTKSAVVDANDAKSALSVNTGDTLVYTITVGNKGAADSRGWNDMAHVVITDNLPAGVELVSNPAQRTVTYTIDGTVAPGATVTKSFTVKVTSTQDGALVDNNASFTGNSTVNDNPQSGCDDADVKVTVPVKPVTPVTPTPPATPAPQVKAATTLPNTGAGNVVAIALVTSVLGYVGSLFVKKRSLNS